MRYAVAVVSALAIGVAMLVPAAFAGEEGGHDLAAPQTVTVQTDSGNLGTVAGPDSTTPVTEHETDRN